MGQYVPSLPGCGLCLHHSSQPAETPSALPGASTPGPGLSGPQRPPGGPRGGKFAGPQPRRPWAALTRLGQAHARAHADRPRPDHFAAPTPEQILTRLPAGRRWVHHRGDAVQLVDQLAEVTGYGYTNGQTTRLAVWAALLDHLADDGTVTVGHGVLAVRASHHAGRRVAASTARYHLTHLIRDGAVMVAQTGASAEILGAVRDRAATYVLLGPAVRAVTAASLTPDEAATFARLAAQLDSMDADPDPAGDECCDLSVGHVRTLAVDRYHPRKPGKISSPSVRQAVPGRFAPRGPAERVEAVAWLAAIMGWRLDERTEIDLLKITSRFFRAGWSPNAILKGWQIQPDSTPWPGPLPEPRQRDRADRIQIRNLWAVLTFRMAAWTSPAGQPLPPPVPAETPRRGRPQTPRPAADQPVRAARSAETELVLAGLRGRLATLHTKRQTGGVGVQRALLRRHLDRPAATR